MKILVTGAGGFVGGHLVSRLRRDFPTAEVLTPGHGLDISDDAAVSAYVAQTRPDSCVHLAAVSAIADARADPGRAWAVNLHGTLSLARAILVHAPSCRLVFASSSDLYGASFRAGVPLGESALPAPLNTYAATKAAADLALGAMASSDGLRVIRVRPFNHTGPGQLPAFAVPAFARQLARIEAGLQPPVIEVGDLSAQRDFLDVQDVCAAYSGCLQPGVEIAPGTILNVASGTARRIGDVLAMLVERSGVRAEVRTAAGLLRASDIPFAVGDASRAHSLLGWVPEIAFEATLDAVIEDWRRRVRT